MKKIILALALTLFASAAMASCPPGKRFYCQGSKCSCV